ncbi:MAG TPA: VacJ family lipoprotein [Aquabacterium sp.]|nr:VacJ family lipoprotein [Aquabacterium sp.]
MIHGELKSARWKRLLSHALLSGMAVLTMALTGCATKQNPDPLEHWNRKVFAFNEGLDRKVIRPVAQGYQAVTPDFFRTGVSNFFGNVKDIWSTTNLFLQGRFADGTVGVMRVGVNTTLGLGGLLDIATPMRLYRNNGDLGQTLGVWGMGPGAYIVWPMLGSSTMRDSLGLPADLYFSPTTLSHNAAGNNRLRVLNVVNVRANFLGATNLLDDVALDRYAFVRDAYLQRRQNLIYNGDPPMDDDEGAPPPAPTEDGASDPH